MTKVDGKKSGSAMGTGCLALFAIPFAAVSVFMCGLLALNFIEYARMQTWAEVPARIINSELKEKRDDSTTYQVVAEYEYQLHGKTYLGSRVSLHGGSDNIGTFHRRIHEELQQYQSSGQPFRCYVNSNNPSEAILYRDLRVEMIVFFDLFIIVFGGVGWGLLIGSMSAARDARKRTLLAIENPDQPWTWQPAWASNEIDPLGKNWSRGMLFVAAFWNFATAPLWWLLPQEIWKGERWAVAPMALPAIGLWLAIAAIRSAMQWRIHRRCKFRTKSVPSYIGGTLEGRIEANQHLDSDEFALRLSCEEQVESDDTSKWVEKWSEERVGYPEFDVTFGSDGEVIPVLFEIPASCAPTSEDAIRWKLTVTSPNLGRSFRLEYPVPIFAKI